MRLWALIHNIIYPPEMPVASYDDQSIICTLAQLRLVMPSCLLLFRILCKTYDNFLKKITETYIVASDEKPNRTRWQTRTSFHSHIKLSNYLISRIYWYFRNGYRTKILIFDLIGNICDESARPSPAMTPVYSSFLGKIKRYNFENLT